MRVLWQIEKIIFFKIPVYGVNLIKSFMSQHIPYVCKYLFLWIPPPAKDDPPAIELKKQKKKKQKKETKKKQQPKKKQSKKKSF